MESKRKNQAAPPGKEADHHGHRGRLRQRFVDTGLAGFAPHEALELLLTFAIPRRDVKPLARALLAQFGSFHRVLEAHREDLLAVEGIGEVAATLITLLLPLFRQYRQGQAVLGEQPGGPAVWSALCQAQLVGHQVEKFLVISLDARDRVIRHSILSSGDEGETAVYPRLIAQELLRAGASGCVLAHNHPSGLAQPSQADKQLTQALKTILAPLSIRLLDHVIIAGDQVFSFANQGLLSP